MTPEIRTGIQGGFCSRMGRERSRTSNGPDPTPRLMPVAIGVRSLSLRTRAASCCRAPYGCLLASTTHNSSYGKARLTRHLYASDAL